MVNGGWSDLLTGSGHDRRRRFLAPLAEAIAQIERILATCIEEAWAHLARWHARPEGKAALYGALFFVSITLGQHVLMLALAPDTEFDDAAEQRVEKLLIPCKVQGARYLYGVRLVVRFNENRTAVYDMCRKADGTWAW